MTNEEIGGRLADARRTQKSWGQLTASERLGISVGLLDSIEDGIVEPSLSLIYSAAKLYGVSAEWLLTGIEPLGKVD